MSDAGPIKKLSSFLAPRANRGIISTGDYATNVIADSVTVAGALTPIIDLKAPPAFSTLPTRRRLVGRQNELEILDTILQSADTERSAVIHGLSGQGKSTLAAEWARGRWTTGPIRWMPSETEDRLSAGLAGIATALEPGIEYLPDSALVERAIQWLDSHPGWLIVLDNVTNPADVETLVTRLHGRGKFIITTLRPTGWSDLFEALPLGNLELDDAAALLMRSAGLSTATGAERDVDVYELCKELGTLALAVEQAAAYICESGLTVAAYRQLLQAYPAETFTVRAEGVEIDRTMARVWSITLDKVSETPSAGHLLRIAAWLNGGEISSEIIAKAVANPIMRAEAVRRLAAFSLIQHGVGDSIGVHHLVQTVYRTTDDGDVHRTRDLTESARLAAILCVIGLVPDENASMPDTWPIWRMLLPHIETIARNTAREKNELVALLLNAAGTFAISQGMSTLAVELLERSFEQLEGLRGDSDDLTLMCESNLAHALEDRGDLKSALSHFKHVLEVRESKFGLDSPATLAARSNLASAYEASGDLDNAIVMLAEVVADRERVLGSEHPHTLISRNNLAYAYSLAGKPSVALTMFLELLEDRVRIIGAKHPETIGTRHNLAQCLADMGQLDQASEQIEIALTDAVEAFGEANPITLAIHDTTGHVRLVQGRHPEAVQERATALKGRELLLGPDHPETMVSRNNLAYCYEHTGQLDMALSLHLRTLADRERLLGPDHPHTLASRNNVGNAYEAVGDLANALSTLDFAVEEYDRVLGRLDARTLNARVSHAHAHLKNGETEYALELYDALFRDHILTFGLDHENTRSVFMTLFILGTQH